MTTPLLRTALAAWLVFVAAATATAQSNAALNRPVISLCAECDVLQKQVIDRLLVLRDADRVLNEARARLRDARAQLSEARITLESLPRTATAVERQAAQARVAAFDAASRAASSAYDVAEASWNKALDDYVRLNAQLVMCNERCLKSATPGPQVATGTPGAPVPTTDGSQPAPSAAQCPDCARLLEELNRLDYLIWLWNDSLSEMRATRSRLRSERDRLMQGREGLEAAQHDASIRVSDAEYRLRVEQLNTEQGKVDGELEGLGDEIDNAQDTLKQLRKERDEWWPKWNGCNRRCSPKRTQWFTKPMFWIPIGGAIAGVAAAGGGGTTTPAPAVTVAPPTPNVTTTTNPTPAPAAPPTSRRPAETLNVTGCTCVENAAALDGTLQLCQRLHLIRTQGSGTAITLSGDPPLPTFQGTFNEATGEFELRTTTTLGTSSSAVVIAGNVETSGNLHNVRVSFSGLAGRQTLYTLTLAP